MGGGNFLLTFLVLYYPKLANVSANYIATLIESILHVTVLLTLCPTAKKHHLHHGGGCTRPQATKIVAVIQARRPVHVNSLIPAYEALCV